MKKALTFFIAVLTLASCQKKNTPVSCYVCQRYQVVYSSIPALAKANTLYATDTVCHMTDGLMTLYIQQHDYYDTLKNSNDTFTYVENYVTCNVQ